MKVLLVDDEKLQLTRVEECVKKVLPDAELFSYLNPVQALEESKGIYFLPQHPHLLQVDQYFQVFPPHWKTFLAQ